PAPKEAAPAIPREELARELAPPPQERPAPRDTPGPGEPQLPATYGTDRLVLLARDPHWLYAYWEISATRQEEFKATLGPAVWQASSPVLRLYDVTPGEPAAGYLEIAVREDADNWHIHVGRPDHSFRAEFGRRLPDGRFVPLLVSNVATTPRASLSERTDEEWMWLEELYRAYLRTAAGLSSPLPAEEIARRMGVLPLAVSSPPFAGAR
ncbi:MAG: DUF4912 domain-containing protein, partial [Firmicutes bacterium]|nr:DUF4912 domain-containing protein [Bacillota bacterium]